MARRFVHAKRLAFNTNSSDFRVDIPELEGKLDPEEFLDWLSTVESVTKDIPEDKKVKLASKVCFSLVDKSLHQENQKSKEEDLNVGEDEN